MTHQAMCACGNPITPEDQAEMDKALQEGEFGWMVRFNGFVKDENAGSGGWMVAPSTVRIFIEGENERAKKQEREEILNILDGMVDIDAELSAVHDLNIPRETEIFRYAILAAIELIKKRT